MKTLTWILAAISLASCTKERTFYIPDFREEIPVTSEVIEIGYNYDGNGTNYEILIQDSTTEKNYRLIRNMNTEELKLEEVKINPKKIYDDNCD